MPHYSTWQSKSKGFVTNPLNRGLDIRNFYSILAREARRPFHGYEKILKLSVFWKSL